MKKDEIITLNMTSNVVDDGNFTTDYYKDLILYKKDTKTYMILERKFLSNYSLSSYNNLTWNVKLLSFPTTKQNNFIVDMNGIDNFITSKSLVFNDSDIRKIILLHLNVQNKCFTRFGVSGAQPSVYHPGGEVLEFQNIDYSNNTGKSKSVSGYMNLPEDEYSKAIMLSEDGINLREERAVYSHTAWIDQQETNTPINIEVTPEKDGASLLSLIYDFCSSTGLDAAGVCVKLIGNKKIHIKGRVLKHIPQEAFKCLQEATDIATEKEFELPPNSEMQIYGTIYKRYEPEWGKLTNGRQYEKRGHYHALISGEKLDNIHQVFHVREIIVDTDVSIAIELYPINKAFRIYPLEAENGTYHIASSHREAKSFADEFAEETCEIKAKLI
ncbi:hypothetical protein [Anaerocolumna xylanovorans]|uniref:Uncharacterized protein n=1 Tax=Anaerocolumna xylanovorans DSM 12503 TaxID=1121345 RepID=A0A1M7XWH6_9FIRM|nr:hypothetical protein [Anaerocolumna xylanovorans]SHO43134.1 hypothetical protein SAMN02745217_00104 [Anaerocolumna xylanovorans DSM 12503]